MTGSDEASSSPTADRYLAERLRYRAYQEPGEKKLIEDVTGADAVRAVLRILFWSVLWALTTGLAVAGVSLLSGSSGGDSLSAIFGSLAAGGALAALTFLVTFVVVGRRKDQGFISQWEVSLDGRADLDEYVMDALVAAVERRDLPVKVERRKTGAGASQLMVSQGINVICVSVLPFGSGLHVSWTMWRSRSRFRIVAASLRAALAGAVGRRSEFHRVVRTDPARAMREAVHNAIREAVELAAATSAANSP